eukprot:GHVL01021551.1.p1 GENE.GHVL01021551.1~~GHVL01021551.1.p1  ORF type:complete len:184 (+),score=36.52 GHVL01021551.1:343-894(+)
MRRSQIMDLGGIPFMLFIQLPMFSIMFASLRGFSLHSDIFREYSLYGPLWLDSLALADPYGLLPVIAGVGTLLFNDALSRKSKHDDEYAGIISKPKDDRMLWFTRFILLFGLPTILSPLPSGIVIYIIFNGLFSMFISYITTIPIVEDYLNLVSLTKMKLSIKRKDELLSKGLKLKNIIKQLN